MASESQLRDVIRDLTLAGKGVVVVNSTSPQNVDFLAICAISDCVINSITLQSGSTNASGLNGTTLLGGLTYTIPGKSITLTSGVAILYKS